jgi:hypothetical protein
MFSKRQFTPGNKSNSSRLIHYVVGFNAINPDSQRINCQCIPNKYNKNVLGSDSPSVNVTYNSRISQIINSTKGGNVQYGNIYLGQPIDLNYLGRMQGMPGGSGMPIKNKF